jgi:hypothetical protein
VPSIDEGLPVWLALHQYLDASHETLSLVIILQNRVVMLELDQHSFIDIVGIRDDHQIFDG